MQTNKPIRDWHPLARSGPRARGADWRGDGIQGHAREECKAASMHFRERRGRSRAPQTSRARALARVFPPPAPRHLRAADRPFPGNRAVMTRDMWCAAWTAAAGTLSAASFRQLCAETWASAARCSPNDMGWVRSSALGHRRGLRAIRCRGDTTSPWSAQAERQREAAGALTRRCGSGRAQRGTSTARFAPQSTASPLPARARGPRRSARRGTQVAETKRGARVQPVRATRAGL